MGHVCTTCVCAVQRRLMLLRGASWLRRGKEPVAVARSLLHLYRAWGRRLRELLISEDDSKTGELYSVYATHRAFTFLAALQQSRLHAAARINSHSLLAFARWRERTVLHRLTTGSFVNGYD